MITKTTKTGFLDCVAVELEELYGLSTDTKPTAVPNGSVFLEMDTKAVFIFDAEGAKWWPL